MKGFAIAMGLLIAVAAGPAFAQGGGGSGGAAGSGSGRSGGASSSLPEAPVGHRQPRASDFSNEKGLSDPNLPENKEDAALDKKLKSICRGC
ncbi:MULTISPECIES: hypothetical protein [unclassified Bradyrhizobium]|uniref:hypothetical protein n=1 Tax=unclassified Bradyrhizobium TaxID=2631580 RepID=UPI0028E5AC82|nr:MULTISPECIES: hypothetical protein [unclassified Bradyrhizobium]